MNFNDQVIIVAKVQRMNCHVRFHLIEQHPVATNSGAKIMRFTIESITLCTLVVEFYFKLSNNNSNTKKAKINF